MSAGSDIAAEVRDALREAAAATGDGSLVCTLRRPAKGTGESQTPWDAESTGAGAPTDYDMIAVQDMRHIRDRSGTLTGETKTVLVVEALTVAPDKSDLIAVGVAKADVDANTRFHEISDIDTFAPGGVALLHEVTLAD